MTTTFPLDSSLIIFGARALHKSCADLVFVFLSGFHLPERRTFDTDSWYDFYNDFGALIYAQYLVPRILCTNVLVRNAQIIVQIFLRGFFDVLALKICVPESREKLHKICRNICGVPMASPPQGGPTPSPLSGRDSMSQNRVCECPFLYLGAQGLFSFAPGPFKI